MSKANDTVNRFAFLAEGKLFVKAGAEEPWHVECQFIADANDRARRTSERTGWRQRGETPDELMASQLLWRSQAAGRRIDRVAVTGVTAGAGAELLFCISTNLIGGIFAQSIPDGAERRLFHKQGVELSGLRRHPTEPRIALAMRHEPWSGSIAVATIEASRLQELTEGDSLDESPSWVESAANTLVFQSAGMGRDAAGNPSGLGPYRIEQLELDSGEMTTLLDSEAFDYLSPRKRADGTLYCIRRPFEPAGASISPWKLLSDIVLFPYRFVRALVYFFNFISLVFARKPLITSGSPESPAQRASMMLWGRVVDAEKALKRAGKGKSPALVPSSYQLIRFDAEGHEQVLARNVAAFDVSTDDQILYSDGSSVFLLADDGHASVVCRGRLISFVTWL